jgi:hypothetical protein
MDPHPDQDIPKILPKNPLGRARIRKFKENPVCYYCDRSHKRINKFNIDHIIPASKGGRIGAQGNNIVLCCRNCNRDKQDYSPEQYMELCIRRAKRVMYTARPGWWRKMVIFFQMLRVWIKTREGNR